MLYSKPPSAMAHDRKLDDLSNLVGQMFRERKVSALGKILARYDHRLRSLAVAALRNKEVPELLYEPDTKPSANLWDEMIVYEIG